MEQDYKNDFEFFMKHTDEKRVLIDEISKEIEVNKISSLLDIGAGNGEVAYPLSQKVHAYVAIEAKQVFVTALQSLNLKVVEGIFPLDISGTFDLVLLSHSLSYKEDNTKVFLQKAFDLVSPSGELLIITYRSDEDDWSLLLDSINENKSDSVKKGFDVIFETLEGLGEVSVRKVTSHVTADADQDLMNALSFVFSDGKRERKELFFSYKDKISSFLTQKYSIQGKYSFPFYHYFISVKKK